MNIDSNQRTRLIQIAIVAAAAFAIIGGLLLVKYLNNGRGLQEALDNNNSTSISRIDGATAEDVWLFAAEGRLAEIEKRAKQSFDLNDSLLKRNRTLIEQNKQLSGELRKTARDYATAVQKVGTVAINPQPNGQASAQGSDPFLAAATAAAPTTPTSTPLTDGLPPVVPVTSLVKFAVTPKPLAPEGIQYGFKDSKNWLPAGAHASAVIIAGADAPAGVGSQTDPRPVVIRVTDKAISAANAAGITKKSDITGCTITGEARGDLSSERVYIRLLTMTCDNPQGIIEINVRGFAAGTGKAGIRGPVISREGDLLARSFAAGALSGFGDAASSAFAPQEILLNNNNTSESDASRVGNSVKAGLAGGVGTAGSKLADYYIERAEQYQPVVSLKGGTRIEVVFLEGSWIDGRISGERIVK
ncbi:MAG: TraB/VirB10 family protein [Candidatus Puniceispirillales bacterium WSBS_2018_MAG_OTU23]